jgi:hypothetical protein
LTTHGYWTPSSSHSAAGIQLGAGEAKRQIRGQSSTPKTANAGTGACGRATMLILARSQKQSFPRPSVASNLQLEGLGWARERGNIRQLLGVVVVEIQFLRFIHPALGGKPRRRKITHLRYEHLIMIILIIKTL